MQETDLQAMDWKAAAVDSCSVAPINAGARVRAGAVAAQLALKLVDLWQVADTPVVLVVDTTDAWLQLAKTPPPGPVHIDFASAALMHRRKSGHNELLGKAIGVRADRFPRVLDATAGLGRDGFVLADLGCEVALVEQNRVLAWLIEEALAVARISAVTQVREASGRMTSLMADCRHLTGIEADVIYLDPMFDGQKNRAGVKKELATLRALLGAPEPDEESQLLHWALDQNVAKVVVKRPIKGPWVDGRKPSYTLTGKAIRFDVHAR